MADVRSVIEQVVGRTTGQGFTLKDLDDFPHSEYSQRLTLYEELGKWFTGEMLVDYVKVGKKKIDKYPIRLNPIYGACLKHAYALFGEFPDDIDGSLIQPRVKNAELLTDERTKVAQQALINMWSENNGAALQIEAGISSQIYGGVVFRLAYDPFDINRKIPLRIELLKPTEFMAIPRDDDPWTLKEAWLIREITRKTAKELGVNLSRDKGYYVEHWKPQEYEITVDDTPIGFVTGNEIFRIGGENPYNFVPFVYIPHIRVGGFWGTGIIQESVKGLTRELNSRFADAGDAVSDDTHVVGVMKNVRGAVRVVEPIPGLKLLDIGSAQTFTGGEAEPNIEFPNIKRMSEPVLRLIEELTDEFRREVYVPAVAEGEDEGSQRSSATLTTRMWPLVSHIRQERVMWSTGMRKLHKMALIMMKTKKLGNITAEHLDLRLKNRWYSILPRDRQNLIDELAVRAANRIGSLEHLLELAGDVENVPQELTKIMQQMEFEAKLKTMARPAPQEGQSDSNAKANATRPERKEKES